MTSSFRETGTVTHLLPLNTKTYVLIEIKNTFLKITLLISDYNNGSSFEYSVPTPQRTQRISIRNAVPKNSRIL